jgi:hypothetical protein
MSRITTRKSRFFPALVASLSAVALIPAGASAATSYFGSSLNHDPANAGASCNPDFSAPSPNCTHIGSYYPGFSGHAKAASNGTITKIKVLAQGPMTMKFKLVQVRNVSSDHRNGQAEVVYAGPTLNITGPTSDQASNGIYPVQSFPVHIHVKKGQELAIDTSNNQAEYCSDGTPGQLTFSNPILKLGQGFRSSTGVDDCLLLVQAVVNH